MYAVVTLQDSEEVMVAAANWLSIDKKQCYRPPFKSTEKCMEAVQNRDEPAIGWEKLNISFHGEHDDLAKEFNWQGRGDKRPFSQLILTEVIRDAALKHTINRVDCETEIRKYLQKISYKADRLARKRPRDYEGSQREILNVTSHTALDSTMQSTIERQFVKTDKQKMLCQPGQKF
ncbi:hypothetical protein QQF64_013253 [Cirrhinus molitorella]|uniref:Uncharacterized protein n=1 Tax=Cirrhinus molitorella TaxID=172907 RepID=A0ABR3LU88_9TELE